MENVSPIITAKNLNLWYGDFKALKDISLDMGEREITALIGPSGCGKSTFLKTLNRMNDLVPGIRIEGDAAARIRPDWVWDWILRKRSFTCTTPRSACAVRKMPIRSSKCACRTWNRRNRKTNKRTDSVKVKKCRHCPFF